MSDKCNCGTDSMICRNCGAYVSYLLNGLCQFCYASMQGSNSWHLPSVWYECPECHGRFTSPIANYDFTYQCPFCGKIMKGYRL